MKVLGFSGKARHGKDTCALLARKIAEEELGKSMGSWAFAHALRATILGEAAGTLTFEDIWFNKPPEVRELLQRRGTENGRHRFGESLWTLQTEAYLRLIGESFPVHGVTITDVRFQNEVLFVQSGGVDSFVKGLQAYEKVMDAHGFSADEDITGEELLLNTPGVIARVTRAETEAFVALQTTIKDLRKSPDGMALYIVSDRPTLEGQAAQHESETALDTLNKEEEFDGIIVNNMDTTFDDLTDQLRPFVYKLFGEAP